MGSFLGGGGPGGVQVPDIPIPDFKEQGRELAQGLRGDGIIGWFLSMLGPAFWGAIVWFMQFIVGAFDTVMTIWMRFMTVSQGIQNPQFFDLTAATISDLLGIEVSSAQVEQSFRRGGEVAGMEAVGDAFVKQLIAEFATGGALTPEGGLRAANAFMGFLISFSMREANLEFFSSLIPEAYRFGEDFRQYAVDMARNVGLGRLARRVMQAPIQALITTPLTWYYNEKYRPTLFPMGELFRSFTRGFITEDVLDQQMGYHGFPVAWKKPLIQEYQRVPYQTEFFRAYQFGTMTQQQVIDAYKSLGYSPEVAQLLFDYTRYNDANSEINGMLTNLETMRLEGRIDQPTFRGLVDDLPIAPDRKQYFLNRVGQQLEFPRKRLTWAEVQTSYIEGILDVNDVQDWLQSYGYSDEDRYVLTLLLLGKLKTKEAAFEHTQYTYNLAVAKARKKNEPIPPPPAGLAVPPA